MDSLNFSHTQYKYPVVCPCWNMAGVTSSTDKRQISKQVQQTYRRQCCDLGCLSDTEKEKQKIKNKNLQPKP